MIINDSELAIILIKFLASIFNILMSLSQKSLNFNNDLPLKINKSSF